MADSSTQRNGRYSTSLAQRNDFLGASARFWQVCDMYHVLLIQSEVDIL